MDRKPSTKTVYPLIPRRSDGKKEINLKGGKKEDNGPSASQLTPSEPKNGFYTVYQEVGLRDAKSMDWRSKLGGLLAKKLKEKGMGDIKSHNSYILATFPQNYRLFECVKRKTKGSKTDGNERSDAYLYGHPGGVQKRYRSPADFFPHLMWLCSGEEGDHNPDNCRCKFCAPEDIQVKGKDERKLQGVVGDESPKVAQAGLGVPKGSSSRPVSAGSSAISPIDSRTASPRPPMPARQPSPTSTEQNVDRQYNRFVHRAGELVWFQRGQGWALGVVLQRWEQDGGPHYRIQPLSYPSDRLTPLTVSSRAEVRPWLAWSVPAFLNKGLNQLSPPPQYESMDWQALLNKKFDTDGTGHAEVDASILAAKAIDSTWTPLQLIRSDAKGAVTEKTYNALFLGAEKISLGDPILLKKTAEGTGVRMMVVLRIMEEVKGSEVRIGLIGDVYDESQAPHRDPKVPSPAAPQRNMHLPQRINEDLAFRNAGSIAVKGTASFWKFSLGRHRVELDAIKGRWYESLALAPFHPEHDEAARKGEVPDYSLSLNSRQDCVNANRAPGLPRLPTANVRKADRMEALGQAVPAGTRIESSLEPPVSRRSSSNAGPGAAPHGDTGINPRFDTTDDANVPGNSAFSNFMSIDGQVDLPDFGQQYNNNQGSGADHYY